MTTDEINLLPYDSSETHMNIIGIKLGKPESGETQEGRAYWFRTIVFERKGGHNIRVTIHTETEKDLWMHFGL